MAESTAVVTGASRGIGLAIAQALRARGLKVLMVARSREKLQAEAARIGGTAFAADVAEPLEVGRLVEFSRHELGDSPDVLVNAAGTFAVAAFAETTIESFDRMLAANLRAPFVVTRSFLPGMIARARGHVVSVGSIAGRQAFAGNAAYAASKYGLRGLHEVLDIELRGSGVRATLIEPAATDTSLWDAVDRAQMPGLPERSQMMSPEAVANGVIYAITQPTDVTVKYLGIERS